MQSFDDLPQHSFVSPFVYTVDSTPVDYFDLGEIPPADSNAFGFRAEYRGSNPIKVLGFYISPVEPSLYTGSLTPEKDFYSLVEWGSLYNTDETIDTASAIGVSMIQFPPDAEVQVATVRNGVGDSVFNPIPWVGGPEALIVQPGETFRCRILVSPPSDQAKQILLARSLSFQVNISFVEATHVAIRISDGAL